MEAPPSVVIESDIPPSKRTRRAGGGRFDLVRAVRRLFARRFVCFSVSRNAASAAQTVKFPVGLMLW